MRKNRKNYTPEEKVNILKEHLVNGVPVSDLCDQYQLHPTVFYRWQRQLFEQGAAAFQNDEKREVVQLKKKIEKLESKVVTKNEVLGELMEAHIALKKSLGEE
ncbi:MAG: transposase [Anaerolineaceae bacterium]|jgi:transposase-like protein|nr:transposase [Anaerolineaceae bacterium]